MSNTGLSSHWTPFGRYCLGAECGHVYLALFWLAMKNSTETEILPSLRESHSRMKTAAGVFWRSPFPLTIFALLRNERIHFSQHSHSHHPTIHSAFVLQGFCLRGGIYVNQGRLFPLEKCPQQFDAGQIQWQNIIVFLCSKADPDKRRNLLNTPNCVELHPQTVWGDLHLK